MKYPKYPKGTVATVTYNGIRNRRAIKLTEGASHWWGVVDTSMLLNEEALGDIRLIPTLDWAIWDDANHLRTLLGVSGSAYSGGRRVLQAVIDSIEDTYRRPICPACGGVQTVPHDHRGDPVRQAILTLHESGEHRACVGTAECGP